MKIGICGYRGMGRNYLSLFHLHPEVESVIAADVNPDVRSAVAETHPDIPQVKSFDELLQADVDSIAIFTPPWLHAEQTVQALEAGKHVICACPAATTLEDLRRIVDTVERTGCIYMTNETTYYHPSVVYARRLFQDGELGEFVYGQGEYYYRPGAYGFWTRDDYGNMPPMLYCTHSTSQIVSVIHRRMDRVACLGVKGLNPEIVDMRRRPEWADNEFSNMTMLARHEGGGCSRINEMRNIGCAGETGSILCTRGSVMQVLKKTLRSNGLHKEQGWDCDLTELWKDPTVHPHAEMAAHLPASYKATALEGLGMGHEGSHRFLADEFVRAVTQSRRPFNHVWLAAQYCAPGMVAWESLKQDGAWLDVPDFGEPSDGREPLEL
jgi:predicted dehydrogenase